MGPPQHKFPTGITALTCWLLCLPQVHFLHADSCLIPRSLLLEVASYALPSPDYILIDDYWMSFVLSHHLRVPLWKIKGDQNNMAGFIT